MRRDGQPAVVCRDRRRVFDSRTPAPVAGASPTPTAQAPKSRPPELPGVPERAAFPGRFQPFHVGHYRTVRRLRREYDLVVALGSPQKARTPRNPLTAAERERVVRECFPALDLVRVRDEDRGEAGYPDWGRRLVARTDADVVVTGNETVADIVREHTDARVEAQRLHDPDRYSGTEIRRRIRAGEPWRDLVPDCCAERVAAYAPVVAAAGEDPE
nr:adenylyltransferase/cytidyltransferase family protein [Halobacterium sp. CBA1126]